MVCFKSGAPRRGSCGAESSAPTGGAKSGARGHITPRLRSNARRRCKRAQTQPVVRRAHGRARGSEARRPHGHTCASGHRRLCHRHVPRVSDALGAAASRPARRGAARRRALAHPTATSTTALCARAAALLRLQPRAVTARACTCCRALCAHSGSSRAAAAPRRRPRCAARPRALRAQPRPIRRCPERRRGRTAGVPARLRGCVNCEVTGALRVATRSAATRRGCCGGPGCGGGERARVLRFACFKTARSLDVRSGA